MLKIWYYFIDQICDVLIHDLSPLVHVGVEVFSWKSDLMEQPKERLFVNF